MDTDVLVVGGGLSGLALADRLAQQGTDFLLVDTQDRLGGRIATLEVDGAAFDLGPTWFWPGQPRLAAQAERFGIPVFEQYAAGDLMYQDQTGAVQRGRGYASMAGSYRLAGGVGALIDALAGTLDSARVMTHTALVSVQTQPGALTATLTQSGAPRTVTARQIVLAVPPRVVADTVRFEPALTDEQLQALAAVPTWMAGQAKVVAVYDAPHWRDAGLSGDAMSHRGPLVEIHDASPMAGGPFALFGFVGVPADARAAHREELLQLTRAQLVALFGPELGEPRELVLQDWATRPDIATPLDRTTVRQHPRYGLPTPLSALATQGIHFGSTETAHDFGGFLEGALEAAEAVAAQLARAAHARA
ncbi:MAG: FAD-dependent oxidoreductase [Pseudomonadota bacterium]